MDMEMLTAWRMREQLVSLLLDGEKRGFVHFAPTDGPLFISDAPLWGKDRELQIALCKSNGFICRSDEHFLWISPGEAMLCELAVEIAENHAPEPGTFSYRCMRKARLPLTAAGWQCVLEALRMQQGKRQSVQEKALRRRMAVMQRMHDESGFYEVGCFLLEMLSMEKTVREPEKEKTAVEKEMKC